jgi:uncharacterized protein YwqG
MGRMLIADSPLAEAGRQYLDAQDAATWTGLLRPGFHLRAYVPGEEVVGYLGGNPFLPEDAEWPVWEGHGPLTFVAAIDCGSLPVKDLDLPLPESGALLFFYFDGQADEGEATVGYWEPETTIGGSRVLYVPADAEMAERQAPEPITAYPRLLLGGDVIATEPDPEHTAFVAAFGDPYDPESTHGALVGDAFSNALDEIGSALAPHHQIGGYARPTQGRVESEAAYAVHGGNSPEDDEARADLAAGLVLLAQLATDDRAGMSWGDAGTLYWLIHPDDLRTQHFDAAMFTWQSH